MRPAGPVEVLLLKVLFATEFAYLLIDVKVPTILEFLDALSHLVPLILKHLNEFVRLSEFFMVLGRLFGDLLELLLQLSYFILELAHDLFSVLIAALHDSRQVFNVDAKLVSLLDRLSMLTKVILRSGIHAH